MARETGRRGFFKEALNQLMQPVAEFLDDRIGEPVPVEAANRGHLLRPPGALPEAEFLEKCHRCGNCVKNCPANAIFALEERVQSDLTDTPYIDPDEQPCVICDSLACMYVCPSGALQPVYAEDIKIGLAIFNVETCLRTKDVACTYCIDTCPIGADAIHLTTDGIVEVLESGCTGCGVCQYACPTVPKSIVIEPDIAREVLVD
ncbi:4Fe-4S dicluster domain-containing protein [Candidatus Poribacteria bacterium]|nr:4Fe-4S dicluster domain-containing protein [Candidatus Poribacteria bacterium]MYK96920.1 4Fe-4S dicluster domain-containing protein [Candidatus Poribacteria bacterium]